MHRLLAQARAGRPRAVGRLVSLVEDDDPRLPELVRALAPGSGRAHVVGLTGAPGVGKSTTTTALVTALRAEGLVVGVLAVDPSSPFTGGALLGDRVRMQEHALDRGVFIRSMASRGHLGGLAAATPAALRVLEAAGCDVVLVETVGVGQSEVEVSACADTTCVLMAPGTGDAVQVAKAGLLEVGDVFVVNKADRDGARSLVRDLRTMVSLGSPAEATREPGSPWRPPVVQTVASTGEGVGELLAAVRAHRESQQASGGWQRRRRRRAREEIEALALARVRRRFRTLTGAPLDRLAEEVGDGRLDPYTAAAALLDGAPTREGPRGRSAGGAE
ncbi:methylmalonyl Co-A mutase-associated GTPase MeaB [Auraticoccus sp. F435]|uniref:Methylmalonyl Co-A mutase-associated GTPase MeaB n=1 Tax=Auraticoccus cholistanensis TaxID=2656650 RepID=A0A6A9V0V7_9ACTN|nr:methylmalonyl Co-A mutase-associated GTPase MeaB [Auraticoccus cholistanensis]MVA76030.1 methylmalonyl Co-A mutase-associated GTPase MeaB [Auraticoccus cholistanensis]